MPLCRPGPGATGKEHMLVASPTARALSSADAGRLPGSVTAGRGMSEVTPAMRGVSFAFADSSVSGRVAEADLLVRG